MSDVHPWEVIPRLVEAEILTKEQAGSLILNTNAYNRLMLELQSLVTDCQSKGDDQVPIAKLVTTITKVQMMETANY
jgi:hypothetical protein